MYKSMLTMHSSAGALPASPGPLELDVRLRVELVRSRPVEPRRRVGVVADAAADDADEPDAPPAATGPPPAAPAAPPAPPPLPTASPACSGGRWTWGGVTELSAAGVECRAVGMCLREPKPTGVKGLAVEPPSECGGEAKSGRAMKASAGGRWARSSGFKGASVACLLSHTHARKRVTWVHHV